MLHPFRCRTIPLTHRAPRATRASLKLSSLAPDLILQAKRSLCFRLFDSNQDGFAEKAGGDIVETRAGEREREREK